MLDETLDVIISLQSVRPIEILPRRLDELFTRLATEPSANEAQILEDEIWDLWTCHADPTANTLMQQGIAAIARRRWEAAGPLLDQLVMAQPLWPEAWNKRATLKFLSGQLNDSARDIRRTLQLEPRHFGALSGFVQICMRLSDPASALLAARQALRLHPHLLPMRITVTQLGYNPAFAVH
jgi:tetratricopeptide (TPR) repeat protein